MNKPEDKAQEWQPISTAPHDGTEVLLWWPYWRKRPVIGVWKQGEWQTEAKLWDYGTGSPEELEKAQPQAWQPLPIPPQSEGVNQNV